MTKAQLIRLVMEGAGKEFGDRTVALKVGMVFESLAGQLFGSNLNQFEFYSRDIILPVTNRVATLTTALIQTKLNGNGCPRIRPTGASCECMPDSTIFYPVPSFGLSLNVDAVKVPGMIFYRVTNGEIQFSHSLPEGVTEVIATVIPQLSEYADDDLITLPSGIAQLIIDQSIAAVRGDAAAANVFKK